MELKDVILSTLKEIEHSKDEIPVPMQKQKSQEIGHTLKNSDSLNSTHNEALFLESMRERIHVLFEGFQSPNNANIEAKVDLTLNFLEYLLSSIEARLKEIK